MSGALKLMQLMMSRVAAQVQLDLDIGAITSLQDLAELYLDASFIGARLSVTSCVALECEIGALLATFKALASSHDDMATMRLRLGHVRAFLDHHAEFLRKPPVKLPHTVAQLAAQEADLVFDRSKVAGQGAGMRIMELLNNPQSVRLCRWTLRAGREVRSVAYSRDGSKMARAEGSHVVVCCAESGLEIWRGDEHRFSRCEYFRA